MQGEWANNQKSHCVGPIQNGFRLSSHRVLGELPEQRRVVEATYKFEQNTSRESEEESIDSASSVQGLYLSHVVYVCVPGVAIAANTT